MSLRADFVNIFFCFFFVASGTFDQFFSADWFVENGHKYSDFSFRMRKSFFLYLFDCTEINNESWTRINTVNLSGGQTAS